MGKDPLPLSFRSDGNDAYFLFFAVDVLELNHAVAQSEEGMVAADADEISGVDFGAALAQDDRARQNILTAETLHAESLRVGIASVFG